MQRFYNVKKNYNFLQKTVLKFRFNVSKDGNMNDIQTNS